MCKGEMRYTDGGNYRSEDASLLVNIGWLGNVITSETFATIGHPVYPEVFCASNTYPMKTSTAPCFNQELTCIYQTI